MKERPIIFSSESIKAIIELRKTQTRRVVKEELHRPRYNNIVYQGKHGWEDEHGRRLLNLYGEPGNGLWVRETWAHNEDKSELWYRADYPCTIPMYATKLFGGTGWRSPMYMPRWASRIALEITDVRVERLQDITFRDLQAEGMQGEFTEAVKNYMQIWDSLNAKRGYPWSSNPWVWVISFRKVTP